MVRAQDFTWFEEACPTLAVAYCLTLVRDLSPGEALTCFGVTSRRGTASLAELEEHAEQAWSEGEDQMVVGATSVYGWTLLVEPNGYLGVTETLLRSASRGTVTISHFQNVNAVGLFTWAVDGDLRVSFDPLFCEERYGSQPDALLAEMTEAGFDPHGDPDDEVAELTSEAAFALAANLSGVRLTPVTLNESIYTLGWATRPG